MGNIQTSSFVKKLAANDRPTRLAAIESLKKFLTTPRDFPLLEFEKLWKGLFYAMWFSDKPRPQQRLAADLGSLFTIIPRANYHKFASSFWIIMSREWSSIDHHRIDKFLLLVRRALFFQIKRLQTEEWDDDLVQQFLNVLKKVPLSDNTKIPAGITYHVVDIYADELNRVMFEELDAEEDDEEDEDANTERRVDIIENTPLETLIKPFLDLVQNSKNKTLKERIAEELLDDSRLQTWGILDDEEDDEENDADEDARSEDYDKESEDEWKGFN